MFGYIKPYKADLTFGEFEIYKGIYCGLCKQIGRMYGRIYRFTLNYDFTFLSLLSVSLNQDCKGFEKAVCSFNPLKKKTCLKSCDDLSFSTTISMIMLYYKLKDDVNDEKKLNKISKKILMLIVSPARKKALKIYPEIDCTISKSISDQFLIEDEKNADNVSIDMCCDPTGVAMSHIFEYLSNDVRQKKILSKMGYYLGKWVYIIDALDDLEADIKNNSFNPFLKKYNMSEYTKDDIDTIMNDGKNILNIVVAEMTLAYELLDIYRYKSILDNIFYLGLKNVQKTIFVKRGVQVDE